MDDRARLRASPVAFRGTVTDAVCVDPESKALLDRVPFLPACREYRVGVAVHEVWKGQVARHVSVLAGRAFCDIRFQIGNSYLIFASASERGADFETGLCMGSHESTREAAHKALRKPRTTYSTESAAGTREGRPFR